MTGVDIIGALLCRSDVITAAVPLERIKAVSLPDGTALPALIVRLVSSVERQPLKRGGRIYTTDRIAVTVRAANYRDQGAILKLVRDCCAGFTGDLLDATSIAVLTAGAGPDIAGPASSFEQTQDFKVGFNAPTRPTN